MSPLRTGFVRRDSVVGGARIAVAWEHADGLPVNPSFHFYRLRRHGDCLPIEFRVLVQYPEFAVSQGWLKGECLKEAARRLQALAIFRANPASPATDYSQGGETGEACIAYWHACEEHDLSTVAASGHDARSILEQGWHSGLLDVDRVLPPFLRWTPGKRL
jgi:hypothetical protein